MGTESGILGTLQVGCHTSGDTQRIDASSPKLRLLTMKFYVLPVLADIYTTLGFSRSGRAGAPHRTATLPRKFDRSRIQVRELLRTRPALPPCEVLPQSKSSFGIATQQASTRRLKTRIKFIHMNSIEPNIAFANRVATA